MTVVIAEKWNDKIMMTEYHFNNETDKQRFIQMCKEEDRNILILEPNYNSKRSVAS